jgi:hypothetical protein
VHLLHNEVYYLLSSSGERKLKATTLGASIHNLLLAQFEQEITSAAASIEHSSRNGKY